MTFCSKVWQLPYIQSCEWNCPEMHFDIGQSIIKVILLFNIEVKGWSARWCISQAQKQKEETTLKYLSPRSWTRGIPKGIFLAALQSTMWTTKKKIFVLLPFHVNLILYLADKHSSYLSFCTAKRIQVPLSTSDLMTDLITLQYRSVDLAKRSYLIKIWFLYSNV